jgi:hypothetical protein
LGYVSTVALGEPHIAAFIGIVGITTQLAQDFGTPNLHPMLYNKTRVLPASYYHLYDGIMPFGTGR